MTIHLLLECVAAYFGTMAFALLFHVPREYYAYCGICGTAGWFAYECLVPYCSVPVSTFCATVLVIVLSRCFAVRKCCPVTVFLIAGIFPLVPGAGIYWTAYYIVTNELNQAGARGFLTLKTAVAIVLGILVVFEFPQSWFSRLEQRKTNDGF